MADGNDGDREGRGDLEVELRDSKNLEAWLKAQSREVCTAIAARAALRVAPALGTLVRSGRVSAKNRTAVVLPLFRGMAAPWAAVNYPAQVAVRAAFSTTEPAIGTSAASSVNSVRAATFYATNVAFHAVARGAAAARAADAVQATTYSAAFSADAARAAAAADASFIGRGGTFAEILALPLWLQGEPKSSKALWSRLKAALPVDEHWDVWTRWWEARRDGGPAVEALEIFRVVGDLNVEAFWKQAPAVINRALWDKERELIRVPEPEPGPNFQVDQQGLERTPEKLDESGLVRDEQISLHDQLRKIAPRLDAAARKIENEHPEVAFVVSEYSALVDRSFDELDVSALWAMGNGLLALNEKYSGPRVGQTMAGPLEPGFAALLALAAKTHGGFILGFAKGDELTLRADRARLSGEMIERLSQASQALLEKLGQSRQFVEERTRRFYNAIREGLHAGGWETARTGHAAYIVTRNSLIAIGKALVRADSRLGTVTGGILLAHYDPNLLQTQLLMKFMLENARDILSFAEPFPELKIWLSSIIDAIEAEKKKSER